MNTNLDSSPPAPLSSLLISNRGEIASRIMRTCRKMGIRTIAVYAEVDAAAPYVAEADVAIRIEPADFLDGEKLIALAKVQGAEAVHPGYGFLSENAAFAEACAAAGLRFIGPNPNAIEQMGSKSTAKRLMQQQGVPVMPGYQGSDQSLERFQQAAEEIGFPLLLKAAAGGGGKGMRIVQEKAALAEAIEAAQREATAAFGNAELIVEKYLPTGRHIEFQIFGDQHGQVIHLLERECSLQRRYQKIIEESPSPVMTPELRARMGAAAVQAAQALQYDNAGTVEFLYDEATGEFYFLEVNTRLQVEHPVTEAITGLDLVEMQIESAMGLPLRIQQESVTGHGYAIECRLYAEDPSQDFMPAAGSLLAFSVPEVSGLRVDSGVQSGSEVSIYFDPMLAKLIVWAEHRAAALQKMRYVLRQFVCLGIPTNQTFLLALLENPAVQAGQYDTQFLARNPELTQHLPDSAALEAAAVAATLWNWQQREQKRTVLRSVPSGWRNSFYQPQEVKWLAGEKVVQVAYRYEADPIGQRRGQFRVWIDGGEAQECRLIEAKEESLTLDWNGQRRFTLVQQGATYFLHNEQFGRVQLQQQPRLPVPESATKAGDYLAPMPSQVVKVLVEAGQSVREGDALLVLTSMKMENTIRAREAGVVQEVFAVAGSSVLAGFCLLEIGSSSSSSSGSRL